MIPPLLGVPAAGWVTVAVIVVLAAVVVAVAVALVVDVVVAVFVTVCCGAVVVESFPQLTSNNEKITAIATKMGTSLFIPILL
jgi:hypothetical protein